jgi:hypothetical protein
MRQFLIVLLMLGGIGCSLASCSLLWFAIPVGAESLHVAPAAIQIAQPQVTIAYRIATIAIIAALVIAWVFGKAGSWGTCLASLWMALLLTYPYAVMVRDPAIAGDAAWLEAQHRQMVRSTGDLSTSTGVRAEGTFDVLVMTQPPRSVNPIEMSDWLPGQWSLGELPDLVDRLGYSDKFFNFIRLGWVAAMAGCLLVIVPLCAPQGRLEMGRASCAAGVFTTAIVVLCAAGLSWAFAGAADLAAAAEHTAQGNYESALSALARAEQKLPSLEQDTCFVAQTGLLEDALHRDTPAARLYRARLHERAGKSHQADSGYAQLALDVETPAAVRREACRAMLYSAIDALNAGRVNAASRLLADVLTVEPCNLKANFALQLACLRSGDYQTIPKLAQRMDAVYHYFQHDSKLAVVSASYQNALAAEAALGNLDRALAHSQKVVDP